MGSNSEAAGRANAATQTITVGLDNTLMWSEIKGGLSYYILHEIGHLTPNGDAFTNWSYGMANLEGTPQDLSNMFVRQNEEYAHAFAASVLALFVEKLPQEAVDLYGNP